MNLLHLLSSVAVFALSASVFAGASQLLGEAHEDFRTGKLDSAQAKLQTVLSMEPSNKGARALMTLIANQKSRPATGYKRLEQIRLDRVNFQDASLGSTLDFLKKKTTEANNGQPVVNFVCTLPQAELDSRKVTLALTNMPASEVLKYIATLTGLEIKPEAHAIVLKPAQTATAPAPAKAP